MTLDSILDLTLTLKFHEFNTITVATFEPDLVYNVIISKIYYILSIYYQFQS